MSSNPSTSTIFSAIVTGAAQGIGRAVAIRLARLGYNVAITDLPSKTELLDSVITEIKALGRDTLALPGDVSKEADVEEAIKQTVEKLGPLYIMVANAGIGVPVASIMDTSMEEWDRYLSVNLTGVFLCYRAAARKMVEQGIGGKIIGACSTAGKRGSPMMGAYCASKFGVRALTQSLVHESDADAAARMNQSHGSWIDMLNGRTALKRIGTAEDVANLVAYLASEEANFMTGNIVT
ncbi:putative secondary metabolism biosyntheticenzyme [Clathrus columnatus]|uniref:Secondary metabolism biosyntheticenzyme n=1 Tax=Clathrus columnatus TaxID=1419009 RepID=A0AAV5AIM9_9AGAM|nr:putative secondary metabolism biosyntheticenzyme [Clathrus columnatus]